MNKFRISTLLSVVTLGAAFTVFTTGARADEWDKMTKVTISEAIEVPGAVLQPGVYTFRLVDAGGDRHVVTIMNDRMDHVFATINALDTERLEPTGKTVFTFYETPAGQPPAVKKWYYPGDNFGQEFVYKDRNFQQVSTAKHDEITQEVAKNTPSQATVATTPAPAAAETSNSASTAVADNSATSAPQTVIAQNEPPASAPPAPEPAPATSAPVLPQTASDVPLLTLIGLGLLAAAAGMGTAVKKVG